MFMTLFSFLITGILFLILHFFIDVVWPYYVPVSLLFLAIWLKVIQSTWEENVDGLMTVIAKTDPGAATFYIKGNRKWIN